MNQRLKELVDELNEKFDDSEVILMCSNSGGFHERKTIIERDKVKFNVEKKETHFTLCVRNKRTGKNNTLLIIPFDFSNDDFSYEYDESRKIILFYFSYWVYPARFVFLAQDYDKCFNKSENENENEK